MFDLRYIGVLGLVIASPVRVDASVICTNSSGPAGQETVVRVEILDPADGSTIAATAPCSQEMVISGAWSVTGPPVPYDFYVVLDTSGSTQTDSGADVDGDGLLHGPGDTIFMAEVAAAQAFVRALDADHARVAVVGFDRDATVFHALSADLVAADAALEGMRSLRLGNGTGYVVAMQAVAAEVSARGDPANREQLCLFLSDGQPSDSQPQVEAAALDLANLGVVIDTFALGFTTSSALQAMATITGGVFTALAAPGDIIALLPDFVPDRPGTFTAHGDPSGDTTDVLADAATNTFTATVTLFPGPNRIVLTLSAEGANPVAVECAVEVTLVAGLVADAGPARLACEGTRVLLDGRASTAACPAPIFRWLDCLGAEACAPSSDPTCEVDACSDCTDYTLEISCPGEPCTSSAGTRVDCAPVPPLAPVVARACGLDVVLLCGGDASLTNWWDLDAGADGDGDGDPRNDVDVAGCDVAASLPTSGARVAVAWSRGIDCESAQDLAVIVTDPPVPRALDGGICPGTLAAFSCGTAEPGVTYWWDFKDAIDSDGDGDPTRDVDAAGCDVSVSFTSGGTRIVHGWQRDAAGCVFLVAVGALDVSAARRPGEVPDLRASRRGAGIDFAWGSVPGALDYRLARGTVASLWIARDYDHAADDDAGRGACHPPGGTTHDDPDDAGEPGSFYYLVTATNDCAGEGSPGSGWNGADELPRPAREPTSSCP